MKEVIKVLDSSSLNKVQKDHVDRHEVAECVFEAHKPIAFDLAHEMAHSSRFVLVDDYEIWGGGVITEELSDDTKWVRDKVLTRNYKWENSLVTKDQRIIRYGQKPALILISGPSEVDKKTLAKELEKELFNMGRFVYYLGIGNVLYGIDADIKLPNEENHREEHIRRFSETINIMMDAGMIVIATASNLTEYDFKLFNEIVHDIEMLKYDLKDKNQFTINDLLEDILEKRIVFY